MRGLQAGKIGNQIGKLLLSEGRFETFGHQGYISGTLLIDVRELNVDELSIRAHQADRLVVGFLDNTLEGITGLGLDGGGAVTDCDRSRREKHLLDQIIAAEFVADGEQIGAGLSAFAISGVAVRAGNLLRFHEQRLARGGVALMHHGERAVLFARWGLGSWGGSGGLGKRGAGQQSHKANRGKRRASGEWHQQQLPRWSAIVEIAWIPVSRLSFRRAFEVIGGV